jgi:hypothetical protein
MCSFTWPGGSVFTSNSLFRPNLIHEVPRNVRYDLFQQVKRVRRTDISELRSQVLPCEFRTAYIDSALTMKNVRFYV